MKKYIALGSIMAFMPVLAFATTVTTLMETFPAY